jgi:hypothetical protein
VGRARRLRRPRKARPRLDCASVSSDRASQGICGLWVSLWVGLGEAEGGGVGRGRKERRR